MGVNASSLADCVLDGDMPALKALLHGRPPALDALGPQTESSDEEEESGGLADCEWARQVEEAVHTAVAMEVRSPRELQQLQIALELLLLASPAAWSSRLTGSSGQRGADGPGGDDGQNNADWTASHRACVTGNLSFVAFVRQQQTQAQAQPASAPLLDRGTCRDAFGLLPIDLVPPELLRSPEEVAGDLVGLGAGGKPRSSLATTARGRRSAAVQWLRESKAAYESRLVLKRLRQAQDRRAAAKARAMAEAETRGEGGTPLREQVDQQVTIEPIAAPVPSGAFFVEFEPSQERFAHVKSLPGSGEAFAGHVHDREAPLRVRFRVPRADIFLQGYFQLIWRAPGEPRSEEPRYEPQVLRLRDELQRRMDQNPTLEPAQLAVGGGSSSRRLSDEESEEGELGLGSAREVRGWFPLSVAHLPEDSVAHVLFVACDRNLLHRSVVLSTEGVLLQAPPPRDRRESSDYFDSSDEYSDEEEEEEGEEQETGGFRFLVGGEEFRHPSAELDGKEFADVAELETFVQTVVAARKQPSPRHESTGGAKQHDARPSEPTAAESDLEDAEPPQQHAKESPGGSEDARDDHDASDAA